MTIQNIQPEGWAAPRGYSNGMLAPAGSRLLFVGGQIAWDANQRIVAPDDFAGQFRQALANVVEVVRAAGGLPEHLVRLTIYVTSRADYLASLKQLGPAYRELMGKHYPAMACVQVAALVEEGALVEIEGTAALPGDEA
ncbi:MAG: RidA family protein [Planctomycetes bacterium]|nr:RidA family protein [Planctomycetota bacterium]